MHPYSRMLLGVAVLAGCGSEPALRMNSGSSLYAFVQDREGGAPGSELDRLRFKPGLCDGEDLRPEIARLDETSLIRFLERQNIGVRLERPRADLTYVNLTGAGTQSPVRMRVAILASADEAGRELHQAVLQHGAGSWGVHRSNLAVLGPLGSTEDDLTFAAKTKLACWGVFTIAGRDDTFVVPGAYMEL